jgi:threonine/homoserine/homoserine lactone efflux protein
MTPESVFAFAGTFFVLAVTPGAGLAMILSRALGSGMAAGFAVTAGLMLGDFAFLGMAIAGLSAMAQAMGPWFQAVKYAAALYLVWLGYCAFTQAAEAVTLESAPPRPWWKDVGMGLFVTLGNPKPLLFYGALLPSLLDVTAIGVQDYATLCSIVIAISCLVYGAYMVLVERARRMMTSTRAIRRLHQASGTIFIGSGVLVATR